MCRFAASLGPTIAIDTLTTRPSPSIVKESSQAAEREEPVHGDGVDGGDPLLHRRRAKAPAPLAPRLARPGETE